MKWFSKGERLETPTVQTCAADRGGIPELLRSYERPVELRLYRSLRENVPVIDAALSKIVRLLGDFKLSGADEDAQAALDDFSAHIRVGGTGMGLRCFVSSYLDQLLTYGTAVGEIVTYEDGGVAALYNAPVDAVELRRGENPLDVRILTRGIGDNREVAQPELILVSLLNPEPGQLRGTSLLCGLPFVSEILMKIFNCIGQNFERAGNVRFAVTYHPPAAASSLNAKQRVQEIASEWSRAMRDKDRMCDFVSIGDVSIKAIGSSTERMSAQQADILTSELEYYRSLSEPVMVRAAAVYLRSVGLDPRVHVEWSNISLQDETELAAARLDNARAAQIEQSLEVKA